MAATEQTIPYYIAALIALSLAAGLAVAAPSLARWENVAPRARVSASGGGQNANALIDGDRGTPAAISAGQPQPWFQLEFAAALPLREVIVHVGRAGNSDGLVPLFVECSADGRSFRQLGKRLHRFSVWATPVRRVPCRYLRIRSERATTMALAEVEVY